MNKYILSKYKEKEEFIVKVYDILDHLERYSFNYAFPFLDPLEQIIIKEILNEYPDIEFLFNDDMFSSERKQLLINGTEFNISILEFEYNSKFETLDHKQVLGALMSTGLKREFIGDILVEDGVVEFAIISDKKEYIYNMFTSVSRVNVHLHEISHFKICKKKEIIEIISTSLRLDCLLSAIFNISRIKSKEYIENGFVKVNYVTVYDGAYMCNFVNETISVKRNGKVMLGGIVSHTRNNRLVIRIFKYT